MHEKSRFDALTQIPKALLRDIDNWPDAPVPLCYGGDYRALAWCCKPGYSLTFAYKCRRDRVLKEIGLTQEKFMKIKDEFAKKHNWIAPETCFGNLSYCCMRNGGCYRRDAALSRIYKGMSYEEAKAEYFRLKRILACILLKNAEKRDMVAPFIEDICDDGDSA